MLNQVNKYTCDSCGDEVEKPIGESPRGWSCTDEYGDLCPACVAKLKDFIRDFYVDGTELCNRLIRILDSGV